MSAPPARGRLRVGLATPLPPEATGIADYSAELLPGLAAAFELEVFTAQPARVPRELAAGLPLFGYSELPARAAGLDLLVYQLGNNAEFHEEILALLLRHPGVVVLHEFLLHHMIQELTLLRGNVEGYVEEMRYCYGRTGERVIRSFLEHGLPLDRATFPLFERVVDASLGVLVHNESCRLRVLASRPAARIGRVPMPFDAAALEPASEGRAAARRQLGLPADALLVGTFGFVTSLKRMEVALAAFARLRRRRADARFLVVGEVSRHYDLAGALAGGLGDGVERIGRPALEDFHRYMQAVDIAVNLRYPSGGETSATLVRLLGLGLPVAVSDHGPFAELPHGCCLKVPVDGSEEEVLAAYLERLAEDPELRRAIGANARRHALAEHAPERAVKAYRTFLEELAAAPPRPFVARPPLAPHSPDDLPLRLAREVATALADLGIGEQRVGEQVLEEVAGSLVELGLDRGRD